MIVNIRGTHGSGKSTLIKTVMTRFNAQVCKTKANGKPLVYVMTLPGIVAPVHVIGSYLTACGGCDTIQPYDTIWPLVEQSAKQGHVLFEGALVSSSYGEIGRSSEQFGDDFVFAFLDTPLAVCIERIAKRRATKGNTKPVDPASTTYKHGRTVNNMEVFKTKFKRRVVILDHRKPVAQVLKLFYAAEQNTK